MFHPITDHEIPEREYKCSSTLPWTSKQDGVGGQGHAPTALPPGNTRCPLYSRLGGPQALPGPMRKISPSTTIRSPDPPARSDSLHRLSYAGQQETGKKEVNNLRYFSYYCFRLIQLFRTIDRFIALIFLWLHVSTISHL
jgi:hypothetical protein